MTFSLKFTSVSVSLSVTVHNYSDPFCLHHRAVHLPPGDSELSWVA